MIMCGHVNTPVFSSTHARIRARCRRPSTIKNEFGYKLGTGKKKMLLDISLPTEHLGVLKKLSKRVRAFQIEMELESVYF